MNLDVFIFSPAPKPAKKQKKNKRLEYKKASDNYIRLLEKQGKPIACENCGSTNGLTVHHIMKKSKYRNNDYINDPANLLLVCTVCHDGFELRLKDRIYEFKTKTARLISERGLEELFK